MWNMGGVCVEGVTSFAAKVDRCRLGKELLHPRHTAVVPIDDSGFVIPDHVP